MDCAGPEYLGKYQQGSEIPLTLQCVDVDDAPDVPSTHPVARVLFDSATPTHLETRKLGACDQGIKDGVFRLSLFLGSLYSTAGRYLVVFKWSDSDSVAHTRISYFTVNPGGSPEGATIAMHSVERPNAGYLLRQTDSGEIIRSKNPR